MSENGNVDRAEGSRSRALAELRELLGDRLSTAPSVREHHGRDESYHPAHPPDAVAFPESTREVASAVEICARHRCPVIPFGGGTSLEGGVAALEGGVSLDLSGLDRILEIHPDDLDCRVEAGVTRGRLNRAAGDHGLFFPIDPGADTATLGGMAATRASGTNAVRYGTLRENVLGLTAVLADGQVIRTGGRARKSAAGYDLTRLLVGSEGTLGVITEVQLRLHGLPEAIATAVCPFEDLDGAVRTAIETIQWGVPVARMELLDEVQIEATNRYSDRRDPLRPTLFFEFHGSPSAVAEQVATVARLAGEHGGLDWRSSDDPAERAALWHARHHAYWAALALRPGA
ncbi:MAG: FAD-binding protein, partial [Acidobacteriota bacterium]